MKKLVVMVLLLLVVGGGAAYYFEIGVSPQTKRDRFLEKAKSFAASGKTNEAVIEYKNALKVDPAHAASHYELAMLLLNKATCAQAIARSYARRTWIPNSSKRATSSLSCMFTRRI